MVRFKDDTSRELVPMGGPGISVSEASDVYFCGVVMLAM